MDTAVTRVAALVAVDAAVEASQAGHEAVLAAARVGEVEQVEQAAATAARSRGRIRRICRTSQGTSLPPGPSRPGQLAARIRHRLVQAGPIGPALSADTRTETMQPRQPN